MLRFSLILEPRVIGRRGELFVPEMGVHIWGDFAPAREGVSPSGVTPGMGGLGQGLEVFGLWPKVLIESRGFLARSWGVLPGLTLADRPAVGLRGHLGDPFG